MEDRLVGLTVREQEVARLLVRGCRNRVIAAALNLSGRYVQEIITNLGERFGLLGRTAIAVYLLTGFKSPAAARECE